MIDVGDLIETPDGPGIVWERKLDVLVVMLNHLERSSFNVKAYWDTSCSVIVKRFNLLDPSVMSDNFAPEGIAVTSNHSYTDYLRSAFDAMTLFDL